VIGPDLEARRESTLEQAGLRRIATLVAQGVQPHELFAAVAEEVGRVVDAPAVAVARYECDDTATVCGSFPAREPLFRTGTRVSLEGANVLQLIRQGAEPARVDNYAELEGRIADAVRSSGMRSGVGVPIMVAGRVWGAIVAWNTERLPGNTGARLADFTELLAAAIANAEAREALSELADEQAALRRVATLIAQGAAPAEVFEGVSAEVDRVFRFDPATFDVAGVVRFEPGPELLVVGVSKTVEAVPLGSRFPPDELFAPTRVLRTGRSARVGADDLASIGGDVAEFLRRHGYMSQVASPIVVEGRLWGAISVNSGSDLPRDTEERLERFTELVATAVANAESSGTLAQLANEQAALRRVATLVAENASAEKLFSAVAKEVAGILDVPDVTIDRFDEDGRATTVVATYGLAPGDWPVGSRWPLDGPSLAATIWKTGGPARIDDYTQLSGPIAAALRNRPKVRAVGVPIIVGNRVWGMIGGGSIGDFTPEAVQERLARFTELVATAIAKSEAHEQLAVLADEQAALRRVATLVAQWARLTEVFGAVGYEVGRLFGTELAAVGKLESDGQALDFVGAADTHERWQLADFLASVEVLRTGRPARADARSWATAEGETAERLRSLGIVSTVASPIVVEGELWGAMLVGAADAPLPQDTEERLEKFTELVATAISKTESRDALARLVEQQAALRRVATLVAEGAAPSELFTAVAWEVGQLFDFAAVTLNRYEENAVVVLADPLDSGFPVGSRWPFDGDSLAVRVNATRRMARIDDYSDVESSAGARMRERASRSAIGVPIVVEGDLWGLLCVGAAATELLPADTADRIAGFVELVGTAIANGQARDRLRLLAEEQAALRRVATLVARDAPSTEVFAAVATEVGKLLDTDITVVGRYDGDGAATAIGSWSASPGGVPVGTRSVLGGRNVLTLVAETARPARVDGYDDASGEAADIARRHGWRSSIAAPIIVDGRLWGVMLVATQRPETFPADAEERVSAFTDLVATAIANAESKSELAASRRRIVAAADEARRRIERDLHDGIQQRLIALTFRARAMTRKPPDDLPGLAAELSEGLRDASDELREISRGIHPTILTEAGLGPALRALARRSSIPIDVDVSLDERLPEPIEAAAYYIASEALTNVEKHAHANVVQLTSAHDDGLLTLEVRDDGVGGVDARRGSGILGLTDRAEALGGTISIASPPRGGTTLSIRLPTTT
jgi:signal transduction histidine kinase